MSTLPLLSPKLFTERPRSSFLPIFFTAISGSFLALGSCFGFLATSNTEAQALQSTPHYLSALFQGCSLSSSGQFGAS
jgi:hypothetical protein